MKIPYVLICCQPNYYLFAGATQIYCAQGMESILGYLEMNGFNPPYEIDMIVVNNLVDGIR